MEPLDMISGPSLQSEIRKRMSADEYQTIPFSQRDQFESSGWTVERQLKKGLKVKKTKSPDRAFEDKVWAMCAKLGFSELNRERDLLVQYGRGANVSKRINVLAVDDDVVLIIECKSSERDQPLTYAFKQEIESVQECRMGVFGTLKKIYPGRKFKFVFATNNIAVTRNTLDKIGQAQIVYLDEEAIAYYHELAGHLGPAARYQFLGNLFRDEKIESMESTIPAIQGRMGGYTYYSFLIEPERLLKFAYVLHRNNANSLWMPTYQRLIKRPRLKKVSDFVSNGGFFPNSLLINIDNKGKKLRFDLATQSINTSKLGVLHLPRRYRSAYVIDGQHRLYGFANSERAETELIPVVAFVDLPGEKQLELFMQINENQQAVPKNLRLTLKADLEWSSKDYRRQAQALKLRVAQALGEKKTSPLYGRIILGEEKSNDRRCITLDAVNRGIDRGGFIGEFSSKEMRRVGSFYRGSNDATYDPLLSFLMKCFDYLKDDLSEQLERGRADGGVVFTNSGVEAVLRLIGDIVNFLVARGSIDPRLSDPEDVFIQVRDLLKYAVGYLDELKPEEVVELRSWFGSGGPTKYLRRLQTAVVQGVPSFMPDGYLDWRKSEERIFNREAYTMISEIEEHLKVDIKRRLRDRYGETWYKDGVPKSVFEKASTLAAQKNYDDKDGYEVGWWDCLFLINYGEILQHGGKSRWDELYDADYSIPLSANGKFSSWKDRSAWVSRLNEIRKKTHHAGGTAVTEDEYDHLQKVYAHFDLGGTGGNS